MTKSQLIFVYRCSLLCPFNTMVERIYPTNSSRQKNRQTEIHSSVQCFCTQRRPVKAFVELVKGDDATVGGFCGSLCSVGHRGTELSKLLLSPFNTLLYLFYILIILR